jgi:hypothetical protein
MSSAGDQEQARTVTRQPAAQVAAAANSDNPWDGCSVKDETLLRLIELGIIPATLNEARAAYDSKAECLAMIVETAKVTPFEAALILGFVRKKFNDVEDGSPAPSHLPSTLHNVLDASPGSASLTSSSAGEDRETREGTSEIVRESLSLGLRAMSTMASVSGPDRAAIRTKLLSKRATDGGEVYKLSKGDEESFREFIGDMCVWWGELDPPLNAAVSRANHVLSNIPPWEEGGSEYMQRYLLKHNNTFPCRYDPVLLSRSNTKYIKLLSKDKKDMQKVMDASAKLDAVLVQLASYEVETSLSDPPLNTSGNPDGADSGFGGRCRACLEEGHKAANCPHSEAIGAKLRAAFIAGQKSRARTT